MTKNLYELIWCINFLPISKHPIITFKKKGYCNIWHWIKKVNILNWGSRQIQFEKLFEKNRSKNRSFGSLVQVSRGGNGSKKIKRRSMEGNLRLNLIKFFYGKFSYTSLNLKLKYFQIKGSNLMEIMKYWTNKDFFDINGKEVITKI